MKREKRRRKNGNHNVTVKIKIYGHGWNVESFSAGNIGMFACNRASGFHACNLHIFTVI